MKVMLEIKSTMTGGAVCTVLCLLLPLGAAARLGETTEQCDARYGNPMQVNGFWTRAAVPIRRFNADLAERCLMKGDYWTDPSAWTVERIAQFRIGLEHVFSEAKELLKG